MTMLVLAPIANISASGGRLRVRMPGSAMPALETDNPGLIGWICRFVAPLDVDVALSELAPHSRAFAARACDYLREMGALVPPTASGAGENDDDRLHAENRKRISNMMQELYQLACDAAGFGPFAQRALAERDGMGLDARLAVLTTMLSALREDLATLRAPYLARQYAEQGIGIETRDLDLHIGCGPCHLPGWVNIDVHPAPMSTNVLWGLPFAEGSARYVFLSHLLEHLFYPNDVYPFLRDLHRVLKPGGVVRIIVPDIEQCIEAYQTRDAAFFSGRRKHWGGGDGTPTRLEDFLAYAGAGPDPAWLFEAHKFGYDFETLSRTLERCGFSRIVRSEYMRSEHERLRVDANSEVADARYGDAGATRHYSLFVEATK